MDVRHLHDAKPLEGIWQSRYHNHALDNIEFMPRDLAGIEHQAEHRERDSVKELASRDNAFPFWGKNIHLLYDTGDCARVAPRPRESALRARNQRNSRATLKKYSKINAI